MESFRDRDEFLFNKWSAQRLNLEQAVIYGVSEDLPPYAYRAVLEKAHLLDTLLVQAPRRMAMWGLEETTTSSLQFLELLIGEVRKGEEICQK